VIDPIVVRERVSAGSAGEQCDVVVVLEQVVDEVAADEASAADDECGVHA